MNFWVHKVRHCIDGMEQCLLTIIFPAYLPHSVEENKSDEDRYMIGANFWLRGEMQFFDELDRINA